MRGLVLSDLHLFARRSEGDARFAALRPELTRASVLVLNGDIFDFRWSTLPDLTATHAAAGEWLEGLLHDLPTCEVRYVLGNHDCVRAFATRLDAISARQRRFAWHPYWLRLGPAIFVHGDCAQRTMDLDGLRAYRASWQSDPARPSRLAARLYAWADWLGVTRRIHEWQFPRRATVQRVASFIDSACPGWRSETQDCYFGHTHLPFSAYAQDGIRFHNTGSGIRGACFNPLTFTVSTTDRAIVHAHPSGNTGRHQ